jgi:hypothetical protein
VWPEVVRGTEVLLIVLVAIRVVRRHCSSSGGSRWRRPSWRKGGGRGIWRPLQETI